MNLLIYNLELKKIQTCIFKSYDMNNRIACRMLDLNSHRNTSMAAEDSFNQQEKKIT